MAIISEDDDWQRAQKVGGVVVFCDKPPPPLNGPYGQPSEPPRGAFPLEHYRRDIEQIAHAFDPGWVVEIGHDFDGIALRHPHKETHIFIALSAIEDNRHLGDVTRYLMLCHSPQRIIIPQKPTLEPAKACIAPIIHAAAAALANAKDVKPPEPKPPAHPAVPAITGPRKPGHV